LGALAVAELEHALKMSKLVFALSLEALDGNIEPFLEDANKIRPFQRRIRYRETSEKCSVEAIFGKSQKRERFKTLSRIAQVLIY
jgi:histidine ammonia-lyase